MPLTPEEQRELSQLEGEFEGQESDLTSDEAAELKSLEAEFEPQGVTPKEVTPGEVPSVAESVGRGAAQGLTLGFADEITGAAEAVADIVKDNSRSFADFNNLYTKYRDESRQNYDESKIANPASYVVGDVSGSIVSTLVPFGIGAKLAASTFKGAAVLGGIAGAGRADELSDIPEEALIGAVAGGAFFAGGSKIISLLKKGDKSAALALIKQDKNVKLQVQMGSALRRTMRSDGIDEVEKLGETLARRGMSEEQLVDDVIKNVSFRPGMEDVQIKDAILSGRNSVFKKDILPVHNVIDKQHLSGVVDPRDIKNAVQNGILDEIDDIPPALLDEALSRTGAELDRIIGKGEMLTLSKSKRLVDNLNIDLGKLKSSEKSLSKFSIQSSVASRVKDVEEAAVEELLPESVKSVYNNSMRVFKNLSDTVKHSDRAITKRRIELDSFGESALKLKEGISSITKAVGVVKPALAQVGKIIGSVANKMKSHSVNNKNVNELVSLQKMQDALMNNPGKMNVWANRIVGSAGRDTAEFMDTLGVFESVINLTNVPLEQNIGDIYNKQNDILNVVRDFDPETAKSLTSAYARKDDQMVGTIISLLKSNPSFGGFVANTGPGIVDESGKRRLYTEEDKIEAKQIYKQSPIGAKNQTMAFKIIDNGIMPPPPPSKAQAPERQARPKSQAGRKVSDF